MIIFSNMSKLFKNSLWGIISNIIQNIFYSIFFIIVARKYSPEDFSNYIIANSLYGFVLAFSSLGLGQWFVRTLKTTNNKNELILSFFKIQIGIGFVFYILNVLIGLVLYDTLLIRQLTCLIGINVIFDNIIYVIKFINIADLEQRRSFIIITIESFIKLLFGFIILWEQIPILYLAIFLILLRLLTLQLFLSIGTIFKIKISELIKAKVNINSIRTIVFSNWPFIIIGSISVVFWRMGNIIISKYLPLNNVAEYEISFKLFALAETVPVVVSATVFPLLIDKLENNFTIAKNYFKRIYIYYACYGLLSFTFIYSFSNFFIPLFFGKNYTHVSTNTIEMFATMLLFPTALLQANLIIALKMEKTDMILNLISLFVNFTITIFGIHFIKSLYIVNYSIFISFLIFHLLQDYILIRKKVFEFIEVIQFYLYTLIALIIFYFLTSHISLYISFLLFWFCIMTIILLKYLERRNFKSIQLNIKEQ